MTLTDDFLDTLDALRAGDAFDGVLASMRRHVADHCGIALGATRDGAFADALVAGVGPSGETGAPVFGRADRLPPAAAAFVNAALAHALDFDDIHDLARLHPTTVTFPAAWAAVALLQKSIDAERRLLEAVALGNEALCRLGLAARPVGDGPVSGWFTTQLFGAFAAALAAAHVLGLDRERTRHALGLAYMQTAGGKEPAFGVGTTARRIYPAFASMAGVQAVQLARAGLSGPADPLGGAANVYRIYLQQDAATARQVLTARDAWQALAVQCKPWATCRLSHVYVGAALRIRAALQGRMPQRIVLVVNASARKLCEPLAARLHPRTLPDATYSIPFVTAVVLAHGEPTLDLLDERLLADRAVLELAGRMVVEPGGVDGPGHPVGSVIALLEDGSRVEVPTVPPGDLGDAALYAKFASCLRAARRDDAAAALWQDIVATPGRMLAALAAAAHT